MDRIVGIVPAGGRAERMHGFHKELMPIGLDPNDEAKFIVSSERIVDGILLAGATSVHFVLNQQKKFITDYYAAHNLFGDRVNFNNASDEVVTLGMPYTIDYVYGQLRAYDYVIMGMPDTVIDPKTSFSTLLGLLRRRSADLALGLFRTDGRDKGGFIGLDPDTKRITHHVDKDDKAHFPADADNSWAIACWNKKFTERFHEWLPRPTETGERLVASPNRPLLFGYLIDRAITDPAIHIVGDFVDPAGFYWDIGEPEKYFELLRHNYTPGGPSLPLRPVSPRTANKMIFIGHGRSACWTQLRDLLAQRLHLECDHFNRVSVAGETTQERLNEMMDTGGMAFLVMTAEEQRMTGAVAARDNVIHEVGLFQGRLGFRRAIILLEEGCAEFSNIVGLAQIRFPLGDLTARFEDIRQVLEREGFLKTEV